MAGPRQGNLPGLQRLAQYFQAVPAEFRQLVQEQHPAVCQGDLAGQRPATATGQGGGTGGVMRAAEGAVEVARGRGPLVKAAQGEPGQCLLGGGWRQDAGEAGGQQGLAGSRGTVEQEVVAATGGNLEGAPVVFGGPVVLPVPVVSVCTELSSAASMTQVSFVPPPWEELTTREPFLSATRVSPPGSTYISSPYRIYGLRSTCRPSI